jgi:hypothetical protein
VRAAVCTREVFPCVSSIAAAPARGASEDVAVVEDVEVVEDVADVAVVEPWPGAAPGDGGPSSGGGGASPLTEWARGRCEGLGAPSSRGAAPAVSITSVGSRVSAELSVGGFGAGTATRLSG